MATDPIWTSVASTAYAGAMPMDSWRRKGSNGATGRSPR